MAAETQVRPGPVPPLPPGAAHGHAGDADGFVFQPVAGLRFAYRRGQGVRCAADPGFDEAAVATVREGPLWGAIAWANGLVPLHASAVARDGAVHAFTGVSGAGKSTLVAALRAQGWPLFADDVVAMDLDAPGPPCALPGHKRLRLWGDALALTGRTGGARVWPGVDKYRVDPDADDPCHAAALPLASLTLLAQGPECMVEPVTGAAAFAAFHRACYRPEYRPRSAAAAGFARLAALAAAVPVYLFTRPRCHARFERGVAAAAAHLDRLAP